MNTARAILIAVILIVLVAVGLTVPKPAPAADRDDVLVMTARLAKTYLTLQVRTDRVLFDAETFNTHAQWDSEMAAVIDGWDVLTDDARTLEAMAKSLTATRQAWVRFPVVHAYTEETISDTLQGSAVGAKIATLAQHLWADANRTKILLDKIREETGLQAWTTQSNTYRRLEATAIEIKYGRKVTGFVGAFSLTGGITDLLANGIDANIAVLVKGADLMFEVTEDAATIVVGDKNAMSAVVGNLLSVMETPADGITIVTFPGGASHGSEKVGAVSISADRIRVAAKGGKVVGINVRTDTEKGVEAELASIPGEKMRLWMEEKGFIENDQTQSEVLGIASVLPLLPDTEDAGVAGDDTPVPGDASRPQIAETDLSVLTESETPPTQDDVSTLLGPPDEETTSEGYPAWVYYGLVRDEEESVSDVVITFSEDGRVADIEPPGRDRQSQGAE